MYFNNMVFLLVPPYRPMENSIALGLRATKQEHSRCWGFKNTVTSKAPDSTKWGSGSLHAMPAGAEGVMNAGFCKVVLTSTRTHCIRSTSAHTNTSDSVAIGANI